MISNTLTDERIKRLTHVASHRLHDIIVLENIHDPHNAAAALRNCDAFGIQEVHVIFETEKMFNPEKLGKLTSASANKWLTIKTWKTTAECFAELKKRNYTIIATAISEKAVSFESFELPKNPCAIVFGNEGFGITEVAKKLADTLLYIPMYGFVDSLNLSVTVGVVTHYLRTKRMKGSEACYSQSEAAALAEQWIRRDEESRRRV
ncbi:MAG: RNA methyltransferase [Candidatus Roizmanbacteria bacterium]|nr:RNA methyltransferase [Candidatus Roizmanbacteria bacterium]